MDFLDEKAIKCITSNTLKVTDGDVETERKIEVPNIYATGIDYCECEGKLQLIGRHGKPIGKEIDLPVEKIIENVSIDDTKGIITIEFFNYDKPIQIKFTEVFEQGFEQTLVVEDENTKDLITELGL